jgi:AcrR family transcriptional regulator
MKRKAAGPRVRKRFNGEEVVERVGQIEALLKSGLDLRRACSRLKISVPSYYRWRSQIRLNGGVAGKGSRDLILEAAKRIFLRDGFGAGLHAISEEAGVSRQTVYNQFRDKEALFVAVVEAVYTELLLKTPPPTLTGELGDVLMCVGRYLIAGGLDPNAVALFKIGLAEYRHHPELPRVTQRLRSSHVLPSMTADLGHYLGSLMKRGLIRHGNPVLIAEAFSGAVLGQARHRLLSGEIQIVSAKWRESMLLEVVATFCRGLLLAPSVP